MKDRYGFDQEFNRANYQKNYFDDKFLSTKEDADISARRKARIEQARLKAEEERKEEVRKINKRKVARNRAIIIGVLFAAVIAFVAVSGSKLTKLQVEKKEAEKKLHQLQQKTEQLQAELLELDTDEYVKSAARSELHMINEGEVVYVVNPDLKNDESNDDSAK